MGVLWLGVAMTTTLVYTQLHFFTPAGSSGQIFCKTMIRYTRSTPPTPVSDSKRVDPWPGRHIIITQYELIHG